MALSGFSVATNQSLIRDDVWSNHLKTLLLDDLFAMQFVRVITDFPDGTTLNIPSLGEAETFNFDEGQAVKYGKMDEGNFTFSFDTYKGSATAISEKYKQDSFYADQVIAAFVPRQHRALMEAVETDILSKGPNGQTASNENIINTVPHRWVAKGTSQVIDFKDFAQAHLSLTKANVPMTNLVAVLDPTTAYTLQTNSNVTNLLTPAPMWQSVINQGMVTGFKFRFNLFGFDCYVSNYLPNGISETINSVAVTSGVANQFFSAAQGDTTPVIGGFRQQPTVYQEFNKDLQQTEYLTLARWGWKLYRPENMVVVLSSTSVLS